MDAAVPDGDPARPRAPTRRIPAAATERETLAELRAHRRAATACSRSMIGLGYYDTITPAVIQRNVLENPSWYTAYTPYQPEISQGRLEALINFQTMVTDLTGLATANASMLDEAHRRRRGHAARAPRIGSGSNVVPRRRRRAAADQGAARAPRRGRRASSSSTSTLDRTTPALARMRSASFIQYPGASGRVWDPTAVIAARRTATGGLAVVAADLLALTLLKSPGELGADVAVGTSQRFGVPMGFGGPHAGYMAVRAGLERQLPGRLVGVSQDAVGYPAYRLSLQTREQHIRREKATSQHLHRAGAARRDGRRCTRSTTGPSGLERIAQRRRTGHAGRSPTRCARRGRRGLHDDFFDTLTRARAADAPSRGRRGRARRAAYLLRAVDADDRLQFSSTRRPRRRRRRAARRALGAVDGDRARVRDCRAARPEPAGRPARDIELPDAPRVQHAPQRDLDDALPQVPRRQGLRARPRHDPARLVHDEAQRRHRDGGRHLAGVREHPPVRARARTSRATSA